MASTPRPMTTSVAVLIALLAGAALAAASPPGAAPLNKRLLRRNHYSARAQQAAADGQFATAIAYYGKLLKIDPYDRLSQYNLACVLSRDGEVEAALDALERAVELGYDDPAHLGEDPDLVGLAGAARFEGLVASAEACRIETVARSAPSLGEGRPLLLVFHRYGGHSRSCLATWEGAAASLHGGVIAPRGPVALARTGTVFYGWSARRGPSEENIEAARAVAEAALADAGVARRDVILAGRGQGARVAFGLLTGRMRDVRGLVLVDPPPARLGELPTWGAGSAPRVAILAGSQNAEAPGELAVVLRAAGCAVLLRESPGTLEVLPADITPRLVEALTFVLGD